MKRLKILLLLCMISSFVLSGCSCNPGIFQVIYSNLTDSLDSEIANHIGNLYLPSRNEEFILNCMQIYSSEGPKVNLTDEQADELMNNIVIGGYKIKLPLLVSDLPDEIQLEEYQSIFEDEEDDFEGLMARPVTLTVHRGEYSCSFDGYVIHSEEYNEDVIVQLTLSILNNVGIVKSYLDNFEFGKIPTEFIEKYGPGEIIPRAYTGVYSFRTYSDKDMSITFYYRGTTEPEEDDKLEEYLDNSTPFIVRLSCNSYLDKMEELFKER